MSIRPATMRDEDAVLFLLEELFVAPGARPPGYRRERGVDGFRYAVTDPDADVLLADDGGQIVGLASVYAEFPSLRFGRRCWLEDLVVASSRRSEGIGRQLLDAADAWGKAHGCTHLGLVSAAARRDAHRFYTANGMAAMQHFTRTLEGRR
jgi:GNAT superfamily N-acetyltransferase